jgi:hypothetical protein
MIQHDSRVSKLVTCFFRTLHTIKVIKIATIFGPFLRDSKRLICCESHGLFDQGLTHHVQAALLVSLSSIFNN